MASTNLNSTGWSELYAELRRDPGDPDAHAELRRRVGAWARRDLGARGWHTIEDVVAETVETVWERLDQARGPDGFRGFVFGHYLNAKRSATRPTYLTLVPLADDLDVADPSSPSQSGGRDGYKPGLLRSGLDALSDRERAAIELHYFQDLSYGEIGEILQVDEINARQIAFRGRARLRRYIEESTREVLARRDGAARAVGGG